MAGLGDYLELDLPAAREQWRAIAGRPPPVAGARGEVFRPVETLLCLAASLLIDHRHYGGATAHVAEEPVPSLARAFRRPNSSILAKMANLDGSRPNGGKFDLAVSNLVLGRPGRLDHLYRLILRAARAEGIADDQLPDFLLLEGELRLEGEPPREDEALLGGGLLSEGELPSAGDADLLGLPAPAASLAAIVTTQLRETAVRIGQHRFAVRVLQNHQHRCVFCGLRVTVGGARVARMLIASHIKPWRASDSTERTDIRNGLTACPTHDVAFDTGLLTIDQELRVIVAPEIERAIATDPAARAAFGRPPLVERLFLPDTAVPPLPVYIDWHQQHIYRR